MRYESEISELNELLERGEYDALIKKLSEIGEEEHLNPFAMQSLYSFCKNALDRLGGYYKAKVLMYLGNISFVLRKLEEADRFYEESLALLLELAKEEKSYLQDVVSVLINKGNLSYNLRKYDDAEKHYINALEILRDIGDEKEMATILHNLGVLFLTTKKYNNARKVLKEAIEIRTNLAEKDKRFLKDLAETLNNYGILLKSQKDFDEAEKVFEKVLSITNDDYGVLLNLASIKLEKGEFEKAEKIIEEILKLQNIPPYIKAKALVAKAFANEKTGNFLEAGRMYLLAAAISFIIVRQYNLSNLNFVVWLEKAMFLGDEETKEKAKAIMTGLERLYYNIIPDTRDLNEEILIARIIKKALNKRELEDFVPRDEIETAAYLIAKDVVAIEDSR